MNEERGREGSLTLYELTGVFQQVQELEGELTEEEFAALLENVEGNIEEKLESIGRVLKSFEAREKAIDEEIARLKERGMRAKNTRERIKEYVRTQLQVLGRKKVETDLFTFSLRNAPKRVVVLDEGRLPEEYMKVTKTPAKKMIAEAIKRGELPEGVARLVDGAQYLMFS